jgi:hypothetical protein
MDTYSYLPVVCLETGQYCPGQRSNINLWVEGPSGHFSKTYLKNLESGVLVATSQMRFKISKRVSFCESPELGVLWGYFSMRIHYYWGSFVATLV